MAVIVPALGELTRGVARGDYSRGVVLSSRTWLSDGGDLELRSNIERQVVSEWEIEGSMLKRGLWIAGMDRVWEGWNSDALLWHVSESRSDVVWLLDLDTAEEEVSARIKSTIVARGATVLVSRHPVEPDRSLAWAVANSEAMPIFERAVMLVRMEGSVRTSMLQRVFGLGFREAYRLRERIVAMGQDALAGKERR